MTEWQGVKKAIAPVDIARKFFERNPRGVKKMDKHRLPNVSQKTHSNLQKSSSSDNKRKAQENSGDENITNTEKVDNKERIEKKRKISKDEEKVKEKSFPFNKILESVEVYILDFDEAERN